MVIKESQIRQCVRQCIREMIEDYPPMDYERPEGLDNFLADAYQEEEDNYWKEYFEDNEADRAIDMYKEDPYYGY